MKLTSTVLDAPDPRTLAEFYRKLLGWPIGTDEPEWVTLRPPGGGAGLSFQLETQYVPPVWPATVGEQQMQLHLDFEVDGRTALQAAVTKAVAAGARVAEFQPQPHVRVLLDPAGHPFCLWTDDRP
ncbi:VOC family protein [Amycolatopsis sp. AA4]|uniref:VOC family protein n=1 Tax=Actinomycetes TaxID=1760 RepID=UPI0001B57A66|nr:MULTISPECIES: VOC family protein [Actinomycetes]ATY10862.1 VOC family protein [Amycolatopsis sp. AA4]